MECGRFQTATLLPNLKVLIAGGTDNSAELYSYTTPVATPMTLSGPVISSGAFQFTFTNTSGAAFSVFAAADPSLPGTNWSLAGHPTEVLPGHFQFTDPQPATNAQRFYRVRSP